MKVCPDCQYFPPMDMRAWAQNGRCYGCHRRLTRERDTRVAARRASRKAQHANAVQTTEPLYLV